MATTDETETFTADRIIAARRLVADAAALVTGLQAEAPRATVALYDRVLAAAGSLQSVLSAAQALATITDQPIRAYISKAELRDSPSGKRILHLVLMTGRFDEPIHAALVVGAHGFDARLEDLLDGQGRPIQQRERHDFCEALELAAVPSDEEDLRYLKGRMLRVGVEAREYRKADGTQLWSLQATRFLHEDERKDT